MSKEEAEQPRPHMEALGFVRGPFRIHCPGHYFFCYAKQVGEYTIELDHDFCVERLEIHIDEQARLRMPEERLDDVEYITKVLNDWSWYVSKWRTKAEREPKRSLLQRLFP